MSLPDYVEHFPVYIGCRVGRTCQRTISAQVGVVHGLKSHHVVFFTHPVASDHRPGEFRRLFYIVRCTGGDSIEHNFFSRTPAGKSHDAVEQFVPVHQIMFSAVDLHGISQSPRSPRYDGYLVDRRRMDLHCGNEGMSDLMIRHEFLLRIGKDCILFLRPCKYGLDAFFQIGSRH